MNDCLLVKWIWKIFSEPNELWFKVIKAKYLVMGVFFSLMPRGVPSFGKACTRLNISLSGGLFFRLEMGGSVGSGKTIGLGRFH